MLTDTRWAEVSVGQNSIKGMTSPPKPPHRKQKNGGRGASSKEGAHVLNEGPGWTQSICVVKSRLSGDVCGQLL